MSSQQPHNIQSFEAKKQDVIKGLNAAMYNESGKYTRPFAAKEYSAFVRNLSAIGIELSPPRITLVTKPFNSFNNLSQEALLAQEEILPNTVFVSRDDEDDLKIHCKFLVNGKLVHKTMLISAQIASLSPLAQESIMSNVLSSDEEKLIFQGLQEYAIEEPAFRFQFALAPEMGVNLFTTWEHQLPAGDTLASFGATQSPLRKALNELQSIHKGILESSQKARIDDLSPYQRFGVSLKHHINLLKYLKTNNPTLASTIDNTIAALNLFNRNVSDPAAIEALGDKTFSSIANAIDMQSTQLAAALRAGNVVGSPYFINIANGNHPILAVAERALNVVVDQKIKLGVKAAIETAEQEFNVAVQNAPKAIEPKSPSTKTPLELEKTLAAEIEKLDQKISSAQQERVTLEKSIEKLTNEISGLDKIVQDSAGPVADAFAEREEAKSLKKLQFTTLKRPVAESIKSITEDRGATEKAKEIAERLQNPNIETITLASYETDLAELKTALKEEVSAKEGLLLPANNDLISALSTSIAHLKGIKAEKEKEKNRLEKELTALREKEAKLEDAFQALRDEVTSLRDIDMKRKQDASSRLTAANRALNNVGTVEPDALIGPRIKARWLAYSLREQTAALKAALKTTEDIITLNADNSAITALLSTEDNDSMLSKIASFNSKDSAELEAKEHQRRAELKAKLEAYEAEVKATHEGILFSIVNFLFRIPAAEDALDKRLDSALETNVKFLAEEACEVTAQKVEDAAVAVVEKSDLLNIHQQVKEEREKSKPTLAKICTLAKMETKIDTIVHAEENKHIKATKDKSIDQDLDALDAVFDEVLGEDAAADKPTVTLLKFELIQDLSGSDVDKLTENDRKIQSLESDVNELQADIQKREERILVLSDHITSLEQETTTQRYILAEKDFAAKATNYSAKALQLQAWATQKVENEGRLDAKKDALAELTRSIDKTLALRESLSTCKEKMGKAIDAVKDECTKLLDSLSHLFGAKKEPAIASDQNQPIVFKPTKQRERTGSASAVHNDARPKAKQRKHAKSATQPVNTAVTPVDAKHDATPAMPPQDTFKALKTEDNALSDAAKEINARHPSADSIVSSVVTSSSFFQEAPADPSTMPEAEGVFGFLSRSFGGVKV